MISFILSLILGFIDRILYFFVGTKRKNLGIQSIELPEAKEIKGETKPRISPLSKNGFKTTLVEGLHTLSDLWDYTVKKHGNRDCMGKRTLKRVITKGKLYF
jgi:hypothetical protein